MENKKIYKNFLLLYKYLPTLVSSIDKLITTRGVYSSNIAVSTCDTTYNQVDSIISLMRKKILLINLKIATNEILAKMDKNYSKLLILRYIDGLSVKYISEKLQINLRTCFRRLNKSIDIFSLKMDEFISEKPEVFLREEDKKCMDKIFSKLEAWGEYTLNNNVERSDKIDTIICNSIFKDMKKKSYC